MADEIQLEVRCSLTLKCALARGVNPKLVKKGLQLEGDEVAKTVEKAATEGISHEEAAVKVLQEKVGTQNIRTLGLRDSLTTRPDITGDPEKFALAKRLHAAGEIRRESLKL